MGTSASRTMTEPSRTSLRDPDAPTPPNHASLTWSDARLLGFKPMDDVHEDFYRVVQAMLFSEATNLLQALEAFESHAISHFEQEDEWMRSTDFPPRDCHMEEHAAALQSTREVKQMVIDGQAGVELVHDFATYLLEWFPGHSDYLDSALAAWMSKRRFGGKPVVLRRTLPFSQG